MESKKALPYFDSLVQRELACAAGLRDFLLSSELLIPSVTL